MIKLIGENKSSEKSFLDSLKIDSGYSLFYKKFSGMRSRAFSKQIVLLLLLSLFIIIIPSLVFAKTEVLGQIGFSNPLIELNYSEAVNITSIIINHVNNSNELLSSETINIDDSSIVHPLESDYTKWGVQLSSLEEGNYQLIVEKQPYGGYSDLETDTVKFTIVFSLSVDFISPRPLYSKSGAIKELWAQEKPFNLTLETDRTAVCSYMPSSSDFVEFQTTGSSIHSNQFSATINTPLKCTYEGHNSLFPEVLVSYLNSPLQIEASFDPEIITDLSRLYTNLSVKSVGDDRELFCYYFVSSGDSTFGWLSHDNSSIVDYYSEEPSKKIVINNQAKKTYSYTVSCIDKSGREAIDTIDLEVDLSNSILVDILSPSLITALVDGKVNFTIGAMGAGSANYLTSTCKFDDKDGDLIGVEDELIHSSLESRSEGHHDEIIWCEANNIEASEDISYTIDSEAPKKPSIRAYDTCGSLFQVAVNPCVVGDGDEQDCDVAEYNYSLYKSNGDLIFSDISSNEFSSFNYDSDQGGSSLQEGQSYTWKVIAFDSAGNPSPEASATTKVYYVTDERCDALVPLITPVVEETGCNMKSVILDCDDQEDDGGSGCASTYNYSIIPTGYSCNSYNSYNYTHSLSEPLVFERSMRLCYLVQDNNHNKAYGYQDIDVGTLSSEPELEILRPGDFTNEDPVVLQVAIGMYDSGFCSYLSGDCSSEGEDLSYNIQTKTHYLSLTNLEEGDYERDVECSFGEEVLQDSVYFTVDRTPPNKPILEPYNNAVVCNDEFKITAKQPFCDGVTITNCEPVYQYNYSLLFGNKIVDNVLTSDEEVVFSDLGSLPGQTYTWKVVAMDEAGNQADPVSVSVKVGDDSSVNCDVEPPILFVNVTNTSSGLKEAIVYCDDDEDNGGSGCTSQFNYSLLATNAVCNYTNRKVYEDPILIRNSSKLCYYGEDNNDNFFKDSKVILVDAVSVAHCDNGVLDPSLGESDIDCGDSCGYCEVGQTCNENYDCLSDTCVDNVCKAPSCDDGILNGNESDVDCGGSCDACEIDKYCFVDSDCVEGLVCDSKCGAPSDFDGDGIPDDIDDDDDNDGILDIYDDNPYYNDALNNNNESDGNQTGWGNGEGDGSSPQTSSLNIFGLVLLIIGLLIMGGSGYWLYYEYERKNGGSPGSPGSLGSFDSSSSFDSSGSSVIGSNGASFGSGSNIIPSSSSSSSNKSDLSSEQVIALQKQKEGAVRLNDKIKNKIKDKQSKRDSLVAGFEVDDKEVDKKESSEFGKRVSANDLPKFGKQEIEEVSNDEFIDIRDVGKKEKKFTEEENKSIQDDDSDSEIKNKISSKKKKKKEIDETFGELDDLIGDK